MDKEKIDSRKSILSCEECCAIIAPSGSPGVTSEVDDYVFHFCGPECYAKWKERKGCCTDHKSAG